MGQTTSQTHRLTPDELSRRLSHKLAAKCFTSIELYSLKDNFHTLAEPSPSSSSTHTGLRWTEDTLIHFLSLPSSIDVGPIIFAACGVLGAFPFTSPERVPAVLDLENMVKVVAILTGRYRRVVKRPLDETRLLFRAFAVTFNEGGPPVAEKREGGGEKRGGEADTNGLFSIGGDEDDEDDDDDDFSMAALEALDAVDVFRHQERPRTRRRARIPRDTLRRLIALLLVLAPLEANESTDILPTYVDRFSGEPLEQLWGTTDNIMLAFDGLGTENGLAYREFKAVLQRSMPFLFTGLKPLFTNTFLFSKKANLSGISGDVAQKTPREPLLRNDGKILDVNGLSQLSLFVAGDRLWRRLRLLYAGSEAGFSNGSLQTKVVKWNAPTIVLISGQRIGKTPQTSRERAFDEMLPPKRYPQGQGDPEGRVVYGAFLQTPWKTSHKDCWGDGATLLFQLSPAHQVFPASSASTDYAYFNTADGFGFGSRPQQLHSSHRASPYLGLGAVSLTVEPGMEFGVFQHVGSGGAFRRAAGAGDWQDRFEIDEIEVWGCGGESEAEAQRKAWAWEEREALLRRQINLGKDLEADRALLEMAGLVGQNRSGGSMG